MELVHLCPGPGLAFWVCMFIEMCIEMFCKIQRKKLKRFPFKNISVQPPTPGNFPFPCEAPEVGCMCSLSPQVRECEE